jgi:selenium metabolism protein YedF
MQIVDTSGLTCPAPLIATKRALKENDPGDKFQVITDNLTSLTNILRFLKDNKISFSHNEVDGKWIINVTKGSNELISPEAESYCETVIPHLTKGKFVIAFTSDTMGEGDEDLGRLLTGNFIKALKDLDHLPAKIVFYNKGVMLGRVGSPYESDLSELENMGVTLLFCATCIDHYTIRDQVRIGHFSNMFEIAQTMASASHVIKP